MESLETTVYADWTTRRNWEVPNNVSIHTRDANSLSYNTDITLPQAMKVTGCSPNISVGLHFYDTGHISHGRLRYATNFGEKPKLCIVPPDSIVISDGYEGRGYSHLIQEIFEAVSEKNHAILMAVVGEEGNVKHLTRAGYTIFLSRENPGLYYGVKNRKNSSLPQDIEVLKNGYNMNLVNTL